MFICRRRTNCPTWCRRDATFWLSHCESRMGSCSRTHGLYAHHGVSLNDQVFQLSQAYRLRSNGRLPNSAMQHRQRCGGWGRCSHRRGHGALGNITILTEAVREDLPATMASWELGSLNTIEVISSLHDAVSSCTNTVHEWHGHWLPVHDVYVQDDPWGHLGT